MKAHMKKINTVFEFEEKRKGKNLKFLREKGVKQKK